MGEGHSVVQAGERLAGLTMSLVMATAFLIVVDRSGFRWRYRHLPPCHLKEDPRLHKILVIGGLDRP